MQKIKGLDLKHAGILLIVQPVIQTVFSPIAGKLSDSVEPKIVASIGMAITFAGLFCFIFLGQDTNLWLIALIMAVVGLGFALFSSPNTNAVMCSVDKKSYGIASATLATMRNVGQTFSNGIIMLVFALIIGKVKIEPVHYPQFLQSIRIIFIIFSALCFIGIFMSLSRGKKENITNG